MLVVFGAEFAEIAGAETRGERCLLVMRCAVGALIHVRDRQVDHLADAAIEACRGAHEGAVKPGEILHGIGPVGHGAEEVTGAGFLFDIGKRRVACGFNALHCVGHDFTIGAVGPDGVAGLCPLIHKRQPDQDGRKYGCEQMLDGADLVGVEGGVREVEAFGIADVE